MEAVEIDRAALAKAKIWAPPGKGKVLRAIAPVENPKKKRPARLVVEPGEPAAVLVRLSASAELLVIGARAHSEEGNLLGGVTVPRCLDRAWCPVDICADQAAHVS